MNKYQALTAQGKDAYLQALTAIGWFDVALTPKEEIAQRIHEEPDLDALCCCLWDGQFDAEGFEDDAAYRALLTALLNLIGMKSAELQVAYIEDDNTVEIALRTAARRYQYSIPLESDWIDDGLIEDWLNNTVLPGENNERRFLALPPTDQTVQFVFVSEALYDKAVNAGIIPEAEDYFLEEPDD